MFFLICTQYQHENIKTNLFLTERLSIFSDTDPTQMNNVMPTSPLLPQMAHQHSYPSLGQITNPYEQQPPGKELNKYASLKAVGK